MTKQITIRREDLSLNCKTHLIWEMRNAWDGILTATLTGHEKQGDRITLAGHDLAQEPMTRTAVVVDAQGYTTGNVILTLTLAE